MQQPVRIITIDEANIGQRIDNFVFTQLKGVPKSRLYRALRKGEVRVNKKRVRPPYKLKEGDQVRLPPLRLSEVVVTQPNDHAILQLASSILYEDDRLLVINKPSGMAAHGGSGIAFGVIETFRKMRPEARFLELVHRLDRETSGCLMLAKKRSALRELHQLLREGRVEKRYMALVLGHWTGGTRCVDAPLLKHQLRSGERMVMVSENGKPAKTIFKPVKCFDEATLLEMRLLTGRTHQIRVHAAHIGHPIAGDKKYGDKRFNQKMQHQGLTRLFLHAQLLRFTLPSEGKEIVVEAELDELLLQVLARIDMKGRDIQ